MFHRTYYTRSDMRRQGKFQWGRPKDENRKRYFRRKTQKKKKMPAFYGSYDLREVNPLAGPCRNVGSR